MAIDIGPGASKLGLYVIGNYTCFNVENPANADGIITAMQCYFTASRTSVKMGTFYGSGSLWTNRDYESLGSCAGGSTTTFTGLNCECEAGDQIGLHSAYYLAIKYTGQGYYRNKEDTFSAGEKSYTFASDSTVALYATGVSAATVTTQEETDVASTSMTANGNITDTGGSGSDVTRRGFCYMKGTSGDPTTANSTAYDDGTFGTGSFSKSITGLSPSTNYRLRAFAVNITGTSYGATVLSLTTTGQPARKRMGGVPHASMQKGVW